MKILAIESSGGCASCAILEDDNILIEKTGPFKVTHSETLMPMIADAFREMHLNASDMDLIAVSGGPGSFTGLRIGSATAKGLGFALGKQLVHVPTLDALSCNFRDSEDVIVPLMDARRGQVYTGIYRFEKDPEGEPQLVTLLQGCAVPVEELLDIINEKYASCRIIFTGDGTAPSKELIESTLKAEYAFAEGADALQRAGSVGLLGFSLYKKGMAHDAAAEAPEYLRPSQAERVRAGKENA